MNPPDRPLPESYWVVPNRFLAGEYPLVFGRPEYTLPRLQAFLQAGFDTFVDLTTPGEHEAYETPLLRLAAESGKTVQYRRFGIGDFGLPEKAQMRQTLAFLQQRLQQGGRVYLHCFGGIGRTGTTVACYLVEQGMTPQQALHQLSQWWRQVPKSSRYPHSPETLEQEAFVQAWQAGTIEA